MTKLRDPESEKRYVVSAEHWAEATEGGDRLSATGGVYFVECAGFIKIGLAWVVQQRLVALQVSCPLAIVPLGYIHVETSTDALELDAELHKRFSKDRCRGEWFADTEELRAVIKSRALPWPLPSPRGRRSLKAAQS